MAKVKIFVKILVLGQLESYTQRYHSSGMQHCTVSVAYDLGWQE